VDGTSGAVSNINVRAEIVEATLTESKRFGVESPGKPDP